jgi:hypothetical protein
MLNVSLRSQAVSTQRMGGSKNKGVRTNECLEAETYEMQHPVMAVVAAAAARQEEAFSYRPSSNVAQYGDKRA